jgi:hypothetical protein
MYKMSHTGLFLGYLYSYMEDGQAGRARSSKKDFLSCKAKALKT